MHMYSTCMSVAGYPREKPISSYTFDWTA